MLKPHQRRYKPKKGKKFTPPTFPEIEYLRMQTRSFEGKKYTLSSVHTSLNAAKNAAHKIRGTGLYFARVISETPKRFTVYIRSR